MKYRAGFLSAALLIPFIATASRAAANMQQWTVASGGNGHYYEAVSQANTISWSDANSAASAAGGYLATITSSAENNFVFSVINSQTYWFQSANNHGPWIGGFQPSGSTEPAGGWTWVNETGAASPEPFSFTNWTAGEPSNDGGIEDSLCYFKSGTGLAATWNDASNSNTFERSYVIEFDSNPLPEPTSAGLWGIAGIFGLRRPNRKRQQA